MWLREQLKHRVAIVILNTSATLKERTDWQFQDLGQFKQPTPTNPVHTLLVFLQLLESYAYPRCHVGLCQTFIEAMNANIPAHKSINRITAPW